LGCFGDVLQVGPCNGDSQDEDIEPKGNGALNIHDDSSIIAYSQANEILVGLTPKE
jgi:hypothetical protein